MFIFNDESSCRWFGGVLPAKERLLSLLYQKLESPAFLLAGDVTMCWLDRARPHDPLQLARGVILCKRRMPRHLCGDFAHRPDCEPRGPNWGERGASQPLADPQCSSLGRRDIGPKPAPGSPRGLARERAGARPAAGNFHPGRFCLPRANSRGLKVFHLERQSAFFLSISGQTPTVPTRSLLPNGGAAFSFRLRVILLALLCWNRA